MRATFLFGCPYNHDQITGRFKLEGLFFLTSFFFFFFATFFFLVLSLGASSNFY